MAMTADNHHSPRGSGSGNGSGSDGINGPHVRRKHLPSPWAQVVRGELEPASVASQPQSSAPRQSTSPQAPAAVPEQASSSPPPPSEDSHAVTESPEPEANSRNAAPARPKKQAWSKPPPNDGATATSSDAGPLIGDAVSWPELSKAARPVPKVGSTDSSSSPSRTVPEGSSSNSQAPAAVTNSPGRQVHSSNNPNPNPNPTLHATVSARQRPNKQRAGGGNFHPPPPSVQHIPPPPPPPPFPIIPVPPNAYPNLLPPIVGPSMREPRAGWEGRPAGGFPSQPRATNDQRNSSRRLSFGSHARGEGQRDRGNYGSGRDVNAQSHRANSRSYVRSPTPPHSPPPFLHPPPPGRPFVTPVPYADMGHLYYPPVTMDPFRGGMIYPNGPPLPLFFPATEPLPVSLVRQIEYYFSDDNLAKDEFLKSNMDNEGWVPISLIANFRRVKSMTGGDPLLILNCLKVSTLVEVQDEKLRRRNEWMKWVRAPAQFSSEGGSPASAGSSRNALAASLQNMSVVEAAASSSSTSPPEHPDGQGTDNTESSHS